MEICITDKPNTAPGLKRNDTGKSGVPSFITNKPCTTLSCINHALLFTSSQKIPRNTSLFTFGTKKDVYHTHVLIFIF